jgi:hypothetical protein
MIQDLKELPKKFFRWSDRQAFVSGVIYPSLVGVPPVFVQFLKQFGPKNIQEWVGQHGMIIFLFSAAWVVVMTVLSGVFRWVRKKIMGSFDLEMEDLVFLMTAFDHAVGNKMQRFGRAAARARTEGPLAKKEVFEEITQPDHQIRDLMSTVYHIFRNKSDSCEKAKLSVILFRMENGKPSGFFEVQPADASPSTSIDQFKNKNSSPSVSAKQRSTIIVENIGKEIKKKKRRLCVEGNTPASNKGSLICHPVFCNELNETPFVISVKSSVPHFFKEAYRQRYESILGKVAKRISMEYSLSVLKSNSQ